MAGSILKVWRRGFLENLRFAGEAVVAHKLRAALTVLGIVIGVATVIAMVSLVEGFDAQVRSSFESFGATLVQFQRYDPQFGPGNHRDASQRQRKPLTFEDAMAMRADCPAMGIVSPEAYWFPHPGAGSVPVMTYQGREATPDTIIGATEAYLAANARELGEGRFFSEADVRRGSATVVLGSAMADALFPYTDPIGKEVTLSGRRYAVIGVLASSGPTLFESSDSHVMMPFPTFERLFPWALRDNGVNIATVPKSAALVDDAIEQGTNLLRRRRGVPFDKPNDFGIMTPDKLISSFTSVTNGIAMTMILIASIALVVGGVGVMNIMLVSVTERTREIGVRKAVGALKQDILVQFLIEAMSLSGIGGAIGVGIGLAIAFLVRHVTSLATSTPLWSILVGLGVSISVGLGFGIFPAWRAARLDPIDALRYE